jgi:hypothetical protein
LLSTAEGGDRRCCDFAQRQELLVAHHLLRLAFEMAFEL